MLLGRHGSRWPVNLGFLEGWACKCRSCQLVAGICSRGLGSVIWGKGIDTSQFLELSCFCWRVMEKFRELKTGPVVKFSDKGLV